MTRPSNRCGTVSVDPSERTTTICVGVAADLTHRRLAVPCGNSAQQPADEHLAVGLIHAAIAREIPGAFLGQRLVPGLMPQQANDVEDVGQVVAPIDIAEVIRRDEEDQRVVGAARRREHARSGRSSLSGPLEVVIKRGR